MIHALTPPTSRCDPSEDLPSAEINRAPVHYAQAYRVQRDTLAALCESLISELERDPNARMPHGKRLLLFKLSGRPLSPEEIDRWAPEGGAQ